MGWLYEERDIEELEPCYSNHIFAMTTEKLRKKSAIAAELAYRDLEIRKRDKLLQVMGTALSEIKATDDGGSDQPIKVILDWTINEIGELKNEQKPKP